MISTGSPVAIGVSSQAIALTTFQARAISELPGSVFRGLTQSMKRLH